MMDSIFNLLNINGEALSNYALQSRDVENNLEIERILKRSVRRLKDIEDRQQSDVKRPEFSQQSVNEVIEKVNKEATDGKTDWNLRELRIVSYHLGRFQNSQRQFNFAIGLLEDNWRDLFINGIVFFLMNSWNICSGQIRYNVCEILRKHLKKYTGGIKKYQQLKANLDLFDQSGPARLSALLRAKSISLEEAPIQLGYKPSALSFPYFSDVIIDYVRKTRLSDYDFLEDLFKQKHSLDRTKKLIFAHMIDDADNKSDAMLQSNVSRVARRVLGDINDSGVWAPFTGATPEETALLRKAKDLVTAWYARKSVEAFFDICVQDTRRRKCWLEYVQNVSDFRIVGSTTTRTKLQSDANVAALLRKCYIETNSRVSTTAALVLFIKDKVFVEFSDVGSLYIYNSNHRLIRSIKSKRYIESTTELKDTGIGPAVDKVSSWSYDYSDEGKLTHRGEWEDRFKRWMRNRMGIVPGKRIEYTSPSVIETPKPVANPTIQGSIINARVTDSLPKSEERSTPLRTSLNHKETTSAVEPKTPYPGTRIKTDVTGIQSKWVFNGSVRIIADSKYVYLYVKKSGRTYYLCPNPVTKIAEYDIHMTAIYNSDRMFEVNFTVKNEFHTNSPNRHYLGILTFKDPDVVFSPINSNNVVIHSIIC